MIRKLLLFAAFFTLVSGATVFLAIALQLRRFEALSICVALATWVSVSYALMGVAAHPYLGAAGRLVPECPKCNYDLTSNESGTCPECGTDVDSAQLLKQFQILANQSLKGDRHVAGMTWKHAVALVAIVASAGGAYGIIIRSRNQVSTMIPPEMQSTNMPLIIAEWQSGAVPMESERYSYFAISGTGVVMRVTFVDDTHQIVQSIGVYDNLGRPWIDADIFGSQFSVNRYATNGYSFTDEPVETLIYDKEGECAKERVDWINSARECSHMVLTWRKCDESVSGGESEP